MEIEKVFFQVCSPPPPPPRDQEIPFAHSCSFTLQTSYNNGMLGPGGGEAVIMLKTIYNSSDFNNFVYDCSLFVYIFLPG